MKPGPKASRTALKGLIAKIGEEDWILRPGTKIRFWTPGYRSSPAVRTPLLLSLVSVVSLLSAVGALIYAVFKSLDSIVATAFTWQESVYIAVLHFLLPMCIAYTVITNSPLSRPFILIYSIIMYAATLAGIGYFGGLDSGPASRAITATTALAIVVFWLFATPKMRIYYALLTDKPLPDDLSERLAEFEGTSESGRRARRILGWAADNLETVVLLGFIIVVLYAVGRTG